MIRPLSFTALEGIPNVKPADDLAGLIRAAVTRANIQVGEGDVFVLAQKIVSKAAGLIVDLARVEPSPRAQEIAAALDKDARVIELILRESRSIVTQRPPLPNGLGGVFITEHLSGAIMANSGVDQSNVGNADDGGERALLLPRDPDGAARKLRTALSAAFECDVAVIISDSWGRPWRLGTTGMALGLAGLAALHDYRGRRDMFGRELQVSVEAVADELAGAANIVMGQADEGRPVVLVTGFSRIRAEGKAADMLRPRAEDLFR